MKRAVLFTLIAGVAFAQSRTAVWDTTDVDPAVIGAVILLPPDGGCTLRVLYNSTVGDAGVSPQPQTYPFNGARCPVARNAIQQASYRDLGVGDGGTP